MNEKNEKNEKNETNEMNESLMREYINDHFKYQPKVLEPWKYSLLDLTDEFIFVLLGVVFCALFYWLGGWCRWLCWFGGGVLSLCLMWLIGLVFVRRFCMQYRLTPDHFEFSHGFLSQRVDTYQLSDIIEIDLSRSMWERVIHTGTIIIRFKNGIESQKNPLVIRGMGDYKDMFEQIDYYRNYHRLMLYFGI